MGHECPSFRKTGSRHMKDLKNQRTIQSISQNLTEWVYYDKRFAGTNQSTNTKDSSNASESTITNTMVILCSCIKSASKNMSYADYRCLKTHGYSF